MANGRQIRPNGNHNGDSRPNGGARISSPQSAPQTSEGIISREPLRNPLSVPPELQGKIDEPGNTEIVFDADGGIDSRFCKVIALRLKKGGTATEKIEALKDAKTLLKMGASVGGRDGENILCALAPYLDEADMHLRLFAILGFGVYAAANGEIFKFIEPLARRLEDIAPINRKAALFALMAYGSQSEMRAYNAVVATENSRNREAASELASLYDSKQEQSKEKQSDKLLTLVDSLVGSDAEKSIEAFSSLHDYATESPENASELLVLLVTYQGDDPLVAELKETCNAMTKNAEKTG